MAHFDCGIVWRYIRIIVMELLKEKIRTQGKILKGEVVKVDTFLNHQVDVALSMEMAQEFKRRFQGVKVDKVLTIEASGIALASFVAQAFGCNFVFAKKSKTSNMSDAFYRAKVYSYTHNQTNQIVVSKEYLHKDENILIVDDFLANGEAVNGLMELVHQARGNVVGVAIAIEKGFQKGGNALRKQGIHLESLAIIEKIDTDKQLITFRENN